MKTIPVLLAVGALAAVGLFMMRSGGCDSNAENTAADVNKAATSGNIAQEDSSTPSAQDGTAVFTLYGTEWCPACKGLQSVLDKIAPRYEGTLAIVNVDLERDSSDIPAISKLGFQGNVPFEVLRSSSGEVLWSGMGYIPEDKLVQILTQKGIATKR